MTTTIDAMLKPASDVEIARAMQGMLAGGLGFARAEEAEISFSQRAEVYCLVMKTVPADIISAAAVRLIASEEFFPTAAKWLKECDGPLAERQRMRKRIDVLVADHGAGKAKQAPFVQEPAHVRFAGLVATYRKHQKTARAAKALQSLWELAQRETNDAASLGRQPPDWIAQGVTVRLTDGDHHVTVEEPNADELRALEPLPAGVVEPKAAELTRTEEQQRAIDLAKAGYSEMRFAGMLAAKEAMKAASDETPRDLVASDDYGGDEPEGDF